MDITKQELEQVTELRLVGRFDTTWSEHVNTKIEETIRAGTHRIVLDFAGVEFISSLGIRVLLNHYKRLKAVNGSLSVRSPSAAALAVLKAAGIAQFLLTESVAPAASAPERFAPASAMQTHFDTRFEMFRQRVSTTLTARLVGDPGPATGGGYVAEHCQRRSFGGNTFGLGLGAFGEGFDDCAERFGEFLAADGCAITLPTADPHALPDYVLEQGNLVPEVETLYGIVGAGEFPWMVRFDAQGSGPGHIRLGNLLEGLAAVVQSDSLAFVMTAEVSALVGAYVRRSPVRYPISLELPGIRDSLSFTTERSNERCLAVIVGVAARAPGAAARTLLRPVAAESGLWAHVHAARFPYRPVQRGELPFKGSVSGILGSSMPTGLLHLLADTRPFDGLGDSELLRGACWVGAVSELNH